MANSLNDFGIKVITDFIFQETNILDTFIYLPTLLLKCLPYFLRDNEIDAW